MPSRRLYSPFSAIRSAGPINRGEFRSHFTDYFLNAEPPLGRRSCAHLLLRAALPSRRRFWIGVSPPDTVRRLYRRPNQSAHKVGMSTPFPRPEDAAGQTNNGLPNGMNRRLVLLPESPCAT